MKTIKKIITGLLLAGFFIFFFLWFLSKYTVPILTYHYFGDESVSEGQYRPLLFVKPGNFENQMRYLKDNHYNVISFGDLIEGLKNGKKFPHNTIVITIDDGHKSVFTYAYPVLKKYGFPAIVFLASDYIGTKPDFLNWSEVKDMSKNNISFGGHTRTHVYLPSIKNNKEALWNEIAGSKKVIEAHLGAPIYYFCYPSGGLNQEIEELVKKAGYKGACTTNRGEDNLNRKNFYELDRISVRDASPIFSFSNVYNPIRFRAKLSGYYNIFRKMKTRESSI